ncbi:Hypothetical protein, putative [Bodo saltans]|uniref:Uncharacterized protein n=1 Tax=Bodo saltans TaxID=75058 RepID=A0A0S4JQ17_BODSA|nr:Hypothetical protein, putative [Bodo saltans]|eukprot:CUG91378.1 Hypothetical protein, putative [Bodo saltans]
MSSFLNTPHSTRSPARRVSPYRATSNKRHHNGPGGADVLNASAIPNEGDDAPHHHHVDVNSSAAVAMMSYQGRGSDLRSLLLTTEREVAELREECTVRTTEVDTLKSALQREHESSLRAQTRHQTDLDEMREEYERQQSRLIEQITVLKGVSESALADKNRTAEEGNQRKQQLLHLLDREREEKSQLMADYRQQTETLIAEQGREITGLRNLLDASRSEEEKLLATITSHEERRSELEEGMLKLESALSEERVGGQRRLRELEIRFTQQIDQLRAKSDEDTNSHRHDTARLSHQKETLEDQVRSLTERLRIAESGFDTDRRALRESYDADVAALQEEVKLLKDQREKADAANKRELERASKGDENLMSSLRKTIETLRAEKQQHQEEARAARESSAVEHSSKVSQLTQALDALRSEYSEERTARKEADAARQSAAIKAESLQGQVARLTGELEHTQVESRTRERAVEQDHNQLVDHLRNLSRQAESDNTSLRQQLKKVDLEVQRLVDDSDAKQVTIDSLRIEHQRSIDSLRAAHEQAMGQADQQKQQLNRSIDVLHSQKVQLDAESGRLQRNLSEMEVRYNAAAKQLADERRALEHATAEIQSLKQSLGDESQLLDSERIRAKELEDALHHRRQELDDYRVTTENLEQNIRDSRRQIDSLREEQGRLVRDFEDKDAEVRSRHRHQTEALENQISALKEELRMVRESQFTLDADIRHLRDEASRLQRESIQKDEEHGDILRAMREQEEDEIMRMDSIINGLRDDLSRAQIAKTSAQREALESQRDSERRVAIIQEALDAERSSKHRLHDEIRNKEQLSAELQGTVRLLTTRVQNKEDDLRRLENEVNESSNRIHEAHSVIGKKDAVIGQLNARLRVFESRGSL